MIRSDALPAPDFRCEQCERPVGAHKDGHEHDWEPNDCHWCVRLPAMKRDVARRRKLGHVVAGVDLDKALASYRMLAPFRGNLGKVKLQVGHRMYDGTSGRAFMRQRRIRIVTGSDVTPERVLEVLVHEMVHLACPNHHHDERFRRVFKRACSTIWGIDVPLDAKPVMGNISYGMREIATKKLREKIARGEIELFPPDPTVEEPKPSRAEVMANVVEKRAAHAMVMHKRALTRLKRSKTIEERWRKKVRYYERQAAQKAT